MALNGTMVKIQTVNLGTAQASITFSSIPQTYDDLLIKVSAREATTNSYELAVVINGSSSAIYNWRLLQGSGSTAISDARVSQTVGQAGVLSSSNSTASGFGNAELYFPNYRSSNNKSISIDSVGENNATLAYSRLLSSTFASTTAISSIVLQLSSGDLAAGSTATLYGISRVPTGAKATGGVITEDGNFIIHTFASSGTFTPSANLTSADFLVLAGGGGSFDYGSGAGGGGAGGLRTSFGSTSGGGSSAQAKVNFTSGTNYTITVGAGGAVQTHNSGSTPSSAANGSSSSIAGSGFSTITTVGGGGGGDYSNSATQNGATGGSGGGGGGSGSSSWTGGAGTTNEGYPGGNNIPDGSSGGNAGGGGGAGGAGGNATSGTGTDGGGVGGAGLAVAISGTSITYATGGKGGRNNGAVVNGTANRGEGGSRGASGGSGIVIIRYAK